MPNIIDLTMPVQDHFRWPVDRRLAADFAKGDPFQITYVGWAKSFDEWVSRERLQFDSNPPRVIELPTK